MIYEMRVYEAAEGRANVMRERFRREVAPRLGRHGIDLVAAFVAPEEDGRFTYITRYPDEEARLKAWASFGADAEWRVVKERSEADGPIVARQTVSVFWPAFEGLLLG